MLCAGARRTAAGLVVALAAAACSSAPVPEAVPTPVETPGDDGSGDPGDGDASEGAPGDDPGDGDHRGGAGDGGGVPEALPEVVVDWTMAARFGGDANGDGFVDYACNETDTFLTDPDRGDDGAGCVEIDPGVFDVTLDACATAGDEGAEVSWVVDGDQVDATTCAVTLPLAEGTRAVVASVSVDGAPTAGPTEVEVEVDDLLVVAMGDSWTSGIGVPDVPGPADAYRDFLEALRDFADALERQQRAEDDLDDARDSLRDALRVLDDTEAAADTALDRCFGTVLGVRVVRPTVGACLDALADIGVSIVSDVTRLRSRIRDSIDDAEDAVASARSAVDNATGSFEDARDAVDAVKAAREAAEDESVGDYQHDGCERSANAGPAQAARRLEDADPRTSVTFLHLSCAGARSTDVISSQIRQAVAGTGDRTVDLLLLGVGGNDMQLNTILGELCPRQVACHDPRPPRPQDDVIATWCGALGDAGDEVLPFLDLAASGVDRLFGVGPDVDGDAAVGGWCTGLYEARLDDLRDRGIIASGGEIPNNTSARAWFDDLVADDATGDPCAPDPGEQEEPAEHTPVREAGLGQRYDCVDRALDDGFGARLAAEDVVVWEYIDVAHRRADALCPPGVPFSLVPTTWRSPPGFNEDEIAFAADVFDRMNGAIAAAADRHGWTFVATNAASRDHGSCADDNWISRADQGMFNAPGAAAMAHPTDDGMAYLGRRLADGAAGLVRR